MHKLWLAGTALLLLAGFTGCEKKQAQKVRERSIRVTVNKMEKRLFRDQLPLQGTISPVDHATISAKIGGTLESLKVSAGDRLKKGDILFEIDRQVLKNQVVVKEDEINVKAAALKTAELALKTAEIAFSQAKRDYERAASLAESNAMSRSNLESAETAYKTADMAVQTAQSAVINAQVQLKQAQSNLAIAKKNLDDSIVRAPFDCVIFDTFVEENEYVTAGKNILKLESPDKLEISCYLSAAYYHKVQVGKTFVEFKDLSGKVIGTSNVYYKAPGVDPESRTFEINAPVPAGVNLVSGMLCSFNLVMSEKESWGLPSDAMLLRAGERYIVYVVTEAGRAQEVNVKRGVIDNGYCEVLNAGDLQGKDVVITGQTFVNNNALLDITNRTGQEK